MLDKMISVSPPQKGETPDSKLADSKIFRETSKSDYKRDFEKALQIKLDQKKSDQENASKNEVTRSKDELGADHKADKKNKSFNESLKSPGGIKKRVNEDDDKMVSNIMASNESKVEAPVSKRENLAEIEVDTLEKSKISNESEGRTAELILLNQLGLPLSSRADSFQTSHKALSVAAAKSDLSATSALDLSPARTGLSQQVQQSTEVQPVLQEQSKALNADVELSAELNGKLDAELSAAVGFTADLATEQTSKDLLAKMKAFDADKNFASSKPLSLEQSILSRLQNEQMQNSSQNSGQITMQNLSDSRLSGESQKSFTQQGSDHQKSLTKDFMNDQKNETLDVNQLHQAAGQSHNEFKAQIGIAPAASELSFAKLEENREANISEIMNQAQYLIKKGGGEISVKMSPEGLGEVHLKILLQDGKLNVELQTQNKDVKKLIEDSLSELKSGLAAHRLSLEHIKIDTVGATNADNNMQFQSNLNQGNSESRKQEFWSDYQGNMNNQSGKKSLYGASAGGANVLSRGSTSGSSEGSTASAQRTYGGTKGATLNRVA